MSGCDLDILRENAKLFANSGDPDQTPHFAESDLDLSCLPVTLLGISRLKWVKSVLILFLFLNENMFWVLE